MELSPSEEEILRRRFGIGCPKQMLEELSKWRRGLEERILKMRFGIGFEKKFTLEEIGRELHLTRERIRQIEREALEVIVKEYFKEGK